MEAETYLKERRKPHNTLFARLTTMASPSVGADTPYYALERTFSRRSRKFNVEETAFQFTLNAFPQNSTYDELVTRLHRIFEGMNV